MLGPIGKTAKAALVKAGYELTRPTGHERQFTRSAWEDWFSRDPVRFGRLYRENRSTLVSVDSWVAEADLAGSLWRYGVPEQWNTRRQGLGRTGLNEVECEPTYTDLITFDASHLHPLSYLEIGVSVGKNWLQVIERFPDANIYGLDVEKPNPRVIGRFPGSDVVHASESHYRVDTLSGTPADIRLQHHRIDRHGKPVTYVQGDQFSPDTWASMRGQKFNFVFSDGVHSPQALETELDNLLTNDLLADDSLVMYWDDLVDDAMQSAFRRNVDRLMARYGPQSWFGLYWIHGTYGQKRLNGIFCSSPDLVNDEVAVAA